MNTTRGHRSKAIGIFDSGIGGLTVAAEIFEYLPNEDIFYFGDTGRTPYGPRSPETVRRFSRQNVNFLIEKEVKFIVVACNTASAVALGYIRGIYNIPMIGVITPGAEAAARVSTSGKIGVIGTQGTIESSSYQKALRSPDNKFRIFAKACPLFVALAEEGYVDKPAARLIADDYLAELRTRTIDTLILGCTHYPFLKRTIADVMGPDVRLIDSARETAVAVKRTLAGLKMLNQKKGPGKKRFYVSDSPEKFKKVGERFLGKRIGKVEMIDINAY
jgi:glutamate racemase